MDVQVFAEWLRRQGHRVYQTNSSYWYDAGPRVLQAFPYHWVIEPPQEELNHLLLDHNIIAIRYSTPLDASEGMVSYHVVLKPPYSLNMLPHQARNGVKRGMKCFRIEQVPFERMAGEGWDLQQNTLERQGRLSSMRRDEWQRICLAASNLPGFEAWAAIADGELAAALITSQINDTWCVPYALSHQKYLRDHVNNALFYSVCCELLSRNGVKGIFFSLHSLDAPESVNEFKFRMNLTAVPVRQRVVFHPLVRPFANRFSLMLSKIFLKRSPNNNLFAKTEGMLRFYVNGKLPLGVQEWPECIRRYQINPPEIWSENQDFAADSE